MIREDLKKLNKKFKLNCIANNFLKLEPYPYNSVNSISMISDIYAIDAKHSYITCIDSIGYLIISKFPHKSPFSDTVYYDSFKEQELKQYWIHINSLKRRTL